MQRHDLVQVYANEEALSAAEALVQIFQSEETWGIFFPVQL